VIAALQAPSVSTAGSPLAPQLTWGGLKPAESAESSGYEGVSTNQTVTIVL